MGGMTIVAPMKYVREYMKIVTYSILAGVGLFELCGDCYLEIDAPFDNQRLCSFKDYRCCKFWKIWYC